MSRQQNHDSHQLLDKIDEELRKRTTARATIRLETLRIFVNGKFFAVLDVQEQKEIALEIEESDRLVEVYAPSAQGDILLVSLPIACDEDGGIAPLTATTGKNGGFQFSFAISPTTNNTIEPTNARAKVVVKYQEPLLRQVGHQLRSLFTLRRVWRPSLAFVSLCLIAALIWNAVMVPVTAGDLVKKSISTEKTTLEKDFKAQFIPVRRLRLEEYRPGYSKALSTHYISTWNAEQKSTRLLSRDKNQKDILSGEWQQADGVTSLRYKPGTVRKRTSASSQASSAEMTWPIVKSASVSLTTAKTPLSQSALSAAGIELWRLSPDAADFHALIGAMDRAIVTESKNAWEIRYINPEQASQQVLSAYLKLDQAYHAVAMSVTLRDGNETREFRFTEEEWEKKPAKEVDPKVFIPKPDMIEQPETMLAARTNPQAGSSATPSAAPQTSAAKPMASNEVEIEVKAQLNQIGADLGREVEVERTPDNQLLVHGVVESKVRKEQILNTLSSVKNNPAVLIRIETKEERLRASGTDTAFGQQQETERKDSEHLRKLSRGTLSTAGALNGFFAGKTTKELEELSPATRKKLINVAISQSKKYDEQTSQLIETIRQRFGVNEVPEAVADDIRSLAGLQDAISKLSSLTLKIDNEIASFSDEAVSRAEAVQVQKLLGQARSLAKRIRQAAEKMD